MSEQNSNTGTTPSGPEEEEDRIPQPEDETAPEDPGESGESEGPEETSEEASEETPEGTQPDQEAAGPQEDGPETDSAQEEGSQGDESQGEESDAEEPNGHLKINLTIGDDGRTTVGIKRHDTDLFMTTILTSELDDVLRQVPELTGRAEARWTLEKMNPAYNRNPKSSKAKSSKAKSSKAKTQTNQNRSNPVATAATLQTSSGETPPPEAEAAADPAEPQAEPLRLF